MHTLPRNSAGHTFFLFFASFRRSKSALCHLLCEATCSLRTDKQLGNNVTSVDEYSKIVTMQQFAFFTNPIIQFILGGLFTLKQWIFSSLKHDPVPRENKLYCFYVKNPPKRIALWDRENSQLGDKIMHISRLKYNS